MKNRLFNKLVFWEMFNQLKITGIISGAIYAVIGMITAMGCWVSSIGWDWSEKTTFPAEYFYILLPLVFVFVPIMVKSVFTYQNRRNASDFYHGLPIKRETMFASSLLAVLAWFVGIIIISMIFPIAITVILPHFRMEFLEWIKVIGKMVAIGILVTSGFALGINLTGNNFTNVIVSLMILFIPRVVSSVIFGMVQAFMPFIEMNSGTSLINNSYNLIFGWAIELFSYKPGQIHYMASFGYTIVLALIYFVLAALAHKHRKSEMASQASAYRLVQIVTRMIPAFLFGLAGIFFFLNLVFRYGWEEEEYYELSFYWGMFSMFALSLLSYVIYELITTRKWKKVLQSFKQLPILAGLIVTCTAIIWIGTKATMSRDIDADKIKYVEVGTIDALSWYREEGEVRVVDEDLFEVLDEAYEEQIEEYYSNGDYWKSDSIVLGINQGGLTFYRTFHLSDKDMDVLVEAYLETIDADKIKLELPKYSQYDMYVDTRSIWLDDDQVKQIYGILRQELKEVPYIDVISVPEEEVLTELNVYTYGGNDSFDIYIPISKKTPETYAMLIDFITESSMDETEDLEEIIYKYFENADEYTADFRIDEFLMVSDDKVHSGLGSYSYVTNPSAVDDMCELLAEYVESDGDTLLYMCGGLYMYENEGYNSYDYTFKCSKYVSKEVAEAILEIIIDNYY